MAVKLKQSKRYSLSSLPPDWREKIFSSIHSERLKQAVAVISCVGCRPSELEQGVMVRAENNRLTIAIRGTKLDPEKGRGQPLRLLEVDSTSPWGEFLLQYTLKHECQRYLIQYDAAGISQRLREKTREIWPRRKVLISAYTYRHFLGKSLKESGEASAKIAATLGHASDFSQTAYGRVGRAKRSAGAHGIKSAVASNPIRHSSKTNRLTRFSGPDRCKNKLKS